MMRQVSVPRRPPPETSFDYVGAMLSAPGFALIVGGTLLAGTYGLIRARQDFVMFGRTILPEGGISPGLVFMVLGLVVLVVFALWGRRRIKLGIDPLVRLVVLRERLVWVGSLAMTAQYFVMAGALFLLPVFAQTALGYNALQSGLMMLPMTLAMIVAAMIATRLVGSSKMTPRAVVLIGSC